MNHAVMKKIKLFIAISVLLISSNSFGQFFYSDLTYNMSVPVGNTADFISKTSFRGLTFSVGRFITDELAVDVRFTWTTFYEEVDPQTYTTDNGNGAVTGKQFRYINAYPLTTGLKYVLNTSSEFSPYFGAGLGAYSINERTDMGIYYDEINIWHFGFYPEIGFNYNFSYDFGVNLYARYEYALAAKEAGAFSTLVFGVGFHF